jgi:ethanolamine ammonia-lyase small subunit
MDGRPMSKILEKNPWQALRRFTQARIALGRAGNSLPTEALLAFNLSHAQARDAVHHPLDAQALHDELRAKGFASLDVHSAAPNRELYLRRPDLGRILSDESRRALAQIEGAATDIVVVIADGLSAFAASKQAIPLLAAVHPQLADWKLAPIVVARQARVALGDEIGEILCAKFVVMLIGERPGLSSPDSLSIYLTYEPHVGRTDAERNCISNVRPEGLGYAEAAHKLQHLLTQARCLRLTGVGLKDESDSMRPGRTPGNEALRTAPTPRAAGET